MIKPFNSEVLLIDCRFYVALLACVTLTAQPFTRDSDIGAPVQISATSLGCAWGDVNADGWPDLLVIDLPLIHLYLNNGQGTFSQSNDSSHLLTFAGNQNSAVLADVNNDGWLDIYVSHLGPGTPISPGDPLNPRVNFLYLNQGPPNFQFQRHAGGDLESALNMTWTSEFADYDSDGDLDLFVPGDQGDIDLFFENTGQANFQQRTDLPFLQSGAFSAASSFLDLDTDGDFDLFIGNFMRTNNELYRNLLSETGSLTFEPVLGTDIVTDREDDLTPSWGDLDNDGDLDAFFSVWNNRFDEIFINNGDLTFTKLAGDPAVTTRGWTLGNALGDFDNDGDLDIYAPDAQGPDRLYSNDGSGHFTERSASELGDLASDSGFVSGPAVADYDNDGDLDIFVTATNGINSMMRNDQQSGHHWLGMTLQGQQSNRSGIGARVYVTATIDGTVTRQTRHVTGGPTGDRAHGDQRLHVGLGDADRVDLIEIYWPSGTTQSIHDLAVDQFITIVEQPTVQVEPTTRLVYAWVSNNNQFASLVVVNNPNQQAAEVTMTARRASGEKETVTRSVPAGGFLKADAASLFPNLGKGSGVSIVLESDAPNLRGRWVTNNISAGSGKSPSQGVAVSCSGDQLDQSRYGTEVLYGYLPTTDGLTSAPVIVNLGDRPAQVTLSFYDGQGNLVLSDNDTLSSLPPFQPFAVVANDLLPQGAPDVALVASSNQPITGVAFVFNALAEPAIGNVSSTASSAAEIIYPWVSQNAQFDSIVIANNLNGETASATLTATRATGPASQTTVSIPAHGFLAATAASLFPDLGDGPGFSIKLKSTRPGIFGRWVTQNLDAPSGRSPSQGVAIATDTDHERKGNSILFGFLPVSDGLTSAPVVLNLSQAATDIRLHIYSADGQLLTTDEDALRGLQPNRPFAAVVDQIAEIHEDVIVVAEAPSGADLTGVAFVFNQSAEPAIGNVSAYAFQPPPSSEPVETHRFPEP